MSIPEQGLSTAWATWANRRVSLIMHWEAILAPKGAHFGSLKVRSYFPRLVSNQNRKKFASAYFYSPLAHIMLNQTFYSWDKWLGILLFCGWPEIYPFLRCVFWWRPTGLFGAIIPTTCACLPVYWSRWWPEAQRQDAEIQLAMERELLDRFIGLIYMVSNYVLSYELSPSSFVLELRVPTNHKASNNR